MSVGDKIQVVRNFIGGSCWSVVYFYASDRFAATNQRQWERAYFSDVSKV